MNKTFTRIWAVDFLSFIAIDEEEDANDSSELWEVRDEFLLSSAECDGIMRDCENLFISTAACSASSQSIHIDPFQITSFPVNECTYVVQVNWLASESSNEKNKKNIKKLLKFN